MCTCHNYPVVVVLVLVDVVVDVEVLVLVVLVLVDVLVLVVVDVLVVLQLRPTQLFPVQKNHPCCPVSQNSSPTAGSEGGTSCARIFPVMLVMCVSDILNGCRRRRRR